MNYRFFLIPVMDNGEAAQHLNNFLDRHKIAQVDRQFVSEGSSSFWAISVGYWEISPQSEQSSQSRRKKQPDYRELLSDEQFRDYAALREWRKRVAEEEAVPVFGIFTNEQLAQIVQMPALTQKGMAAISGIGQTRIERYGEAVLQLLRDRRNLPVQAEDASNA